MRNLLFPCAPMESGKTADLSASEAAEMVIRKAGRRLFKSCVYEEPIGGINNKYEQNTEQEQGGFLH